jgi:hypothetical protein
LDLSPRGMYAAVAAGEGRNSATTIPAVGK